MKEVCWTGRGEGGWGGSGGGGGYHSWRVVHGSGRRNLRDSFWSIGFPDD